MGFRFRKSTSLLPGIKLNISKKGIASLSVGKKGAMINLGKDGVRTTVGLPGSGASYSDYHSYDKLQEAKPETKTKFLGWIALIAVIIVISVVMNG